MILRTSSIDWSLERPPLKEERREHSLACEPDGKPRDCSLYKLRVGKLQAPGRTGLFHLVLRTGAKALLAQVGLNLTRV